MSVLYYVLLLNKRKVELNLENRHIEMIFGQHICMQWLPYLYKRPRLY